MLEHVLVSYYKIWHGKFHMKGSGAILSKAAPFLKSLHEYRLYLPEGHYVDVDFRDVSAMYWLNHQLNDTFEEKGLVNAVQPFLRGNNVVWDIGANSGLLSYHLLRLNNIDELHLFEPNPRMSALATQAVSPFQQAEVHPFGLSDKNDDFTLTIPTGRTTMGTLEPYATNRHGMKCKVTCRLGDELVYENGFKPPTVIKIDTEGHELTVFKGLSRTIAEHRPVIFFEHISLTTTEVESLRLKEYALFTVSDATGELIPGTREDAGHNSVLVPES